MGPVKVGDEEPEWLDDDIIRAVRVDVGNPHLVLHVPDPEWTADLEDLGRAVNESTPGGINVELVTPGPDDDEITMRVYERGVGLTEACGTGACAAAAAALAWDLTGPDVVVHQPGGDARVTVGDTATLEVEVHHIATVEFPWP
jgi:diaminopimelate epimerase